MFVIHAMQIDFSPELDKVLEYAREEAMRTGSYAILPDHLLLGILRHADNDACRLLTRLGVDSADLKHVIESQLFRRESISYSDIDRIVYSRNAQSTLNMTVLETSLSGEERSRAIHLLLAVSRSTGNIGAEFLGRAGIGHEQLAEGWRSMQGTAAPGPAAPPRSKPQKRVFSIVVDKNKIYS
ncbi:MAG: hypothetical protein K6D54_06760 [Bacteroidales bacterium]|nr:hypothetical protein [Bacteroidales bacterium]